MRNGERRLGQIGAYWLSRRGNSAAWCRTWFDPTTRQTCRASLGTEDLDEAKLALAAWITANAKLERTQPQDAPLETYLVRYLEQHAKYLPSAEPTRFGLVKWSEFFAGALVSEITPQRQREFVASLRGKGLSDGYIRRILSVGQAALNRAYREGEITAVPRILLSLAPEAEPRERLLTIDEARALFAAATAPHQIAVPDARVRHCGTPSGAPRADDLPSGLRCASDPAQPCRPCAEQEAPPDNTDLRRLVALVARPPGRPSRAIPGKAVAGTKMIFDHLTARVARRFRREATAVARTHRRAGRRAAAWDAIEDGRRRSAAIMEVTAYTIRHTVAAEMRKRGVPVWEVAGFLGHSSGYRTTERYAKFGPDHLAGAVRAIDGYFADLGLAALPQPATRPLRVSSVLVPPAMGSQALEIMVGATGIEPVTPTMST